LVSPYESDPQITYLVQKGKADFAIREDSDLLAYGCEKVCKTPSVFYSGHMSQKTICTAKHQLNNLLHLLCESCVI
jgi:5'-3' exonuclease